MSITKNTGIITDQDYQNVTQKIQNKKIVLVGGCFDLLHYGHYSFLRRAKSVADYLIVLLESDEFIRIRKNRDPIHSQMQRAEILSALNMVDLVIMLPYYQSDAQYIDLVDEIHPHFIAVTEGDPKLEKKRRQAERIGGVLEVVSPLLTEFSSKHIIDTYL